MALNDISRAPLIPATQRKSTDEHIVQHLSSGNLGTAARATITTIQRLDSILKGEPELDPEIDEHSSKDLAPTAPVPVECSATVSCEFFDMGSESRTYFERMKGRAVRIINVTDLGAVTGSSLQGPADVLREDDEMQRVGGAVFELRDEVPVEGAGGVGLGVDEERPAPDFIGESDHPEEDVLEQGGAEPPAFVADVHAEAGEEGDGLRVAPPPFRSRGGASIGWSWAMHQP